jgi:hypothetical protein
MLYIHLSQRALQKVYTGCLEVLAKYLQKHFDEERGVIMCERINMHKSWYPQKNITLFLQ